MNTLSIVQNIVEKFPNVFRNGFKTTSQWAGHTVEIIQHIPQSIQQKVDVKVIMIASVIILLSITIFIIINHSQQSSKNQILQPLPKDKARNQEQPPDIEKKQTPQQKSIQKEEEKKEDKQKSNSIINKEIPCLPKGGFTNSGNSCFMAAALQCFNIMIDILPKNIEQDLKQDEEESEERFTQRKQVCQKILILLEKSNRYETVSAKEIESLWQLWYTYDSDLPSIATPNDVAITYRRLLKLFSIPPLELTFIHKGKRIFFKDPVISFLLEDNNKMNMNRKPFGEDYPIKKDVCCLNNYELTYFSNEKFPLFIPIRIVPCFPESHKFIIPFILKFANSEVEYELVSCGIGGKKHAYSYAKSQDQRWIKYDDDTSHFCNLEAIKSDIDDYGVLLIYRQK